MKLFKWKKCKKNDLIGVSWVKWLKNGVGGFIFHAVILPLYFLVKMLLVKLKNFYTSAYLNLNYSTA